MEDEQASPETQEQPVESAAEETEGAEEPSQQPEAELPAETPPESGDATPRTFSEEEFRKLQSKLDQQAAGERQLRLKAEQEAKAAREQAESLAAQHQIALEHQQVLTDLGKRELAERRQAEQQGTDPALVQQKYDMMRQQVDYARRAYLHEQTIQAQAKSVEARERDLVVREIAYKNSLTPEEYDEVSRAKDPEAAAEILKLKREMEELRTKQATAARQPQDFAPTPSGTVGPSPMQKLLSDFHEGKLDRGSPEYQKVQEYLR